MGFVIKVRERNIIRSCSLPDTYRILPVGMWNKSGAPTLFLFFFSLYNMFISQTSRRWYRVSSFLVLCPSPLYHYSYTYMLPFPLPPIHSGFIVNSNTFYGPLPITPSAFTLPSTSFRYSLPPIFFSATIVTISNPVFLF